MTLSNVLELDITKELSARLKQDSDEDLITMYNVAVCGVADEPHDYRHVVMEALLSRELDRRHISMGAMQ
jgi:hypothetical protein